MIVDIQFGEGGKDSKLFVDDLLSAYLKYAENNKLKSTLVSKSNGNAIIRFKGKGVWKAFQYESGKHVIQRVPPTESNGRRHTSTVSVSVLPLPPKHKIKPLSDSELRIKTQGGHGKGGQHQNTTDSAVRMTHIPTGIQVFINGRDQHTNKREARGILTVRVNEFYNSEKQKSYDAKRKKQWGGGGRSGKIRTYNFIKSRVVDHRLNKKSGQIDKIMKGRFDLLFK